jgi:hypothetical protein
MAAALLRPEPPRPHSWIAGESTLIGGRRAR